MQRWRWGLEWLSGAPSLQSLRNPVRCVRVYGVNRWVNNNVVKVTSIFLLWYYTVCSRGIIGKGHHDIKHIIHENPRVVLYAIYRELINPWVSACIFHTTLHTSNRYSMRPSVLWHKHEGKAPRASCHVYCIKHEDFSCYMYNYVF